MELTKICQPLPVKFTLAEANELLPLIRRISAKHDTVINRALANQRFLMVSGAPQIRVTECDNRVVAELQAWSRKIMKLGVRQFQGGAYGFDSGFGYWSWYTNEPSVTHFHDYMETPAKRRVIGILSK